MVVGCTLTVVGFRFPEGDLAHRILTSKDLAGWPPTGFMVVTAGELYGGMISGLGTGSVDREENAEGVEEKGERGEVLRRRVVP